MKPATFTVDSYEALGSRHWTRAKRTAFWANAAAGITALVTGGIISPVHRVGDSSGRRFIGVGGIMTDAKHFRADARRATVKARAEALASKRA